LRKVALGTISDTRPVTEGYGKEISKYSMKFGLDIDEASGKKLQIYRFFIKHSVPSIIILTDGTCPFPN